MTKFDDLYGGRFLAATDLKGPITAVISKIEEEIFNRDGKASRAKAIVHFKGAFKPVVLNKTNANMLAHSFGKDFDSWIGKSVEVKPETTTFQGKVVLALRLYAATLVKTAEPKRPRGLASV